MALATAGDSAAIAPEPMPPATALTSRSANAIPTLRLSATAWASALPAYCWYSATPCASN